MKRAMLQQSFRKAGSTGGLAPAGENWVSGCIRKSTHNSNSIIITLCSLLLKKSASVYKKPCTNLSVHVLPSHSYHTFLHAATFLMLVTMPQLLVTMSQMLVTMSQLLVMMFQKLVTMPQLLVTMPQMLVTMPQLLVIMFQMLVI